jgi:hypothetical protein
MKITRTKFLVSLALTCLALAGSSSLLAITPNFIISTFDSDLGSNPYGTNVWTDAPQGTVSAALMWTNAGAGGSNGAMFIVADWPLGTAAGGAYQWLEHQASVRPWDASTNADHGLDIRYYSSIDFDVLLKTNESSTNLNGNYGGINVNLVGDPYWGINSTNGTGWVYLGTAAPTPTTTNGGWQHFSMSTLPFQATLSQIVFDCYNWANSNSTMHTEMMVDNVKLIGANGPPPRMQYVKANRGLNMWATAGGGDRNSIETLPGSGYYMWAGSGFPVSYSFTVGAYPTDPAHTNLGVRLYLLPAVSSGDGPADWDTTNCIFVELNVDTNMIATWMFHWKTNAPGANGDLYNTGEQVTITNPTPIGKWTLSFDGPGTGVTMTAPGTGSDATNFTLGGPIVPDIRGEFQQGSGSEGVYLGLFTGGTNAGDLSVTFTAAQVSGLGVTSVSNNWLADTSLTNNASGSVWVPVESPPWTIVPTNNAMWVNWNIPDGGYFLETNTVSVGSPANWSTNHGLPLGTIYVFHRGTLVKPGDLPNTKNLFFRLNSNPTQ